MALPQPTSPPLPCDTIREIDRRAIEHYGIPSLVLMENAARSVAEFVYALLISPDAASVTILCGSGNNGGDGIAAARHLCLAGVRTTVFLAADNLRMSDDARTQLHIYTQMGAPLIRVSGHADAASAESTIAGSPMIVDALLGTGSRGAPRGVIAELIRAANHATGATRVAVDIPSGLDADSGVVAEPCFRADHTLTLVAHKTGFSSAAARRVLGEVVVAGIGAPLA